MSHQQHKHHGAGTDLGSNNSSPPVPNFSPISGTYRERKNSLVKVLGAILAAIGFIGLLLAGLLIFMPLELLNLKASAINALGFTVLTYSAITLVVGLILLTLDYLKRKLWSPHLFEFKNNFMRFAAQADVFPEHLHPTNFKCFVWRKSRTRIVFYFKLLGVGCDYRSLRLKMAEVAEAFEAGQTYEFADFEPASIWYFLGFRYSLLIDLSSVEKAYKKAGEHRG